MKKILILAVAVAIALLVVPVYSHAASAPTCVAAGTCKAGQVPIGPQGPAGPRGPAGLERIYFRSARYVVYCNVGFGTASPECVMDGASVPAGSESGSSDGGSTPTPPPSEPLYPLCDNGDIPLNQENRFHFEPNGQTALDNQFIVFYGRNFHILDRLLIVYDRNSNERYSSYNYRTTAIRVRICADTSTELNRDTMTGTFIGE